MTEATAAPKSNSWRSCLLVCLLIGFFGCCGMPLALDDRPLTEQRIKKFEQDLDANLPYGSTREEAHAWFESRGMQPGDSIRAADNQKAGVMAIVPSNGLFNVREAQIVIYLYFTPEGKYWKRSVYRFGPSI